MVHKKVQSRETRTRPTENDKISTSVLGERKKTSKEQQQATRKQEGTDSYPELVEFSKRSFFPFFLLTLTQPSWWVCVGTIWRLEFSKRGTSLSKSEEADSWLRFWVTIESRGFSGASVEKFFDWGRRSDSASLPSSSELEELESAAAGVVQGVHLLDLDFVLFPLVFFAGRVGQEFCKCPVWWQWRQQNAVFS